MTDVRWCRTWFGRNGTRICLLFFGLMLSGQCMAVDLPGHRLCRAVSP